ncbi:Membrane-bound alkaline phosphatase [Orchesella cincta]|uniref:Alkaline phosphatase n=1 Tax=Orchesella cincta TaxID=48709 RepID=A0A1D2NMX0_ORCCI|nr:Membrane-bound alkaline phosphatase [Orchesella cincta]
MSPLSRLIQPCFRGGGVGGCKYNSARHLVGISLCFYLIFNYALPSSGRYMSTGEAKAMNFVCRLEDPDLDNCMHNFKPHPKQRAGSAKSEDSIYWYENAQSSLRRKVGSETKIEKLAKNVIFFLGDGMSVPTITAARILKGQLEGKTFGEEAELNFERFPNVALSKTFCMDSQVADSACSATAYLSGTLGNIATVGVTSKVSFRDCRSQMNKTNQASSVLAWAQARGMSTGIITTTRVTHASPAGAYASIADRDWENDRMIRDAGENPDRCDDIAEQLVLGEVGKRINVILGGGRRELMPITVRDVESNQPGRRSDGKNLIQTWLKTKKNPKSAKYVWNKQQLFNVNVSETDYLLGLFSYDHMDYVTDADANADPSLPEMTKVAIDILSRNPNGFFLFIEGGRVDHAHHSNKAQKALVETISMDAAVLTAVENTSEQDTLILVTADHSHVMTISGYPQRGNPILGFAGISDVDDLPYTTLSYANGPGYKHPVESGDRYDLTDDHLDHPDYTQMTGLPLLSETHGGDDVPIYSRGPFSHLLTGGHMRGAHCPPTYAEQSSSASSSSVAGSYVPPSAPIISGSPIKTRRKARI